MEAEVNARAILLVLLPFALAAAEPFAGLSAWPAVICADESHRVGFRLDAPAAGEAAFAWDDGEAQVFPVPAGRSDGLLPLPRGPGAHAGSLRLGGEAAPLAIRLVDASEPWPIAGLRDGLPVDAAGVPVVLCYPRVSANDRRRERLGPATPPRPAGRAILVGDPLATPGGDAWGRQDAELRPATHARLPHHAALLALATLGADRAPRTILWCPGNGALYAGTWADESRLCLALVRRCAALAIRPRLVVTLPPWPAAADWREPAEARRRVLAETCQAAGWEVLDLAAVAGDPLTANRLSAGLYAEYPVGVAQGRLHEALRVELAR